MEAGNSSTKPDFKAMSFKELRAYIVEHRQDDEAIHELFVNRRNPDAVQYPYTMTVEETTEILKRKIAGEL